MKKSLQSFLADDNKEIFYYKWLPDNPGDIKAAIQVAHGMAEHAGRYEDFAAYFTGQGFAVYANDHRGHGKTAGSVDEVGFVSVKNGWEIMVKDLKSMSDIIKSENNSKPLFILGHSMGSFLLRDYLFTYPDTINGAALSGTSAGAGFMGKIGKIICSREIKKKGIRTRSPLLDNLSFGKYNSYFKPNRTKFDWLSHNEENVDEYIADPYCGGIFSAGFFRDLINGIEKISNFKNILLIPKLTPIFFMSGEKCPVGNFKKGVEKVYNSYKKAGLKNVKLKFYEGMRHEILNETEKYKVYKDIEEWIFQITD